MTVRRARLFVERELGMSLRARWFLAYAFIFLVGGLFLTTFGLGDTIVYGYRGFAKAIAALVHLSLLFVPMMALVPAVAALADERESGALEYILAQPVTFGEVYWGKWVGVALAVVLAVAIGFGATGAVAVLRGVPVPVVAILLLFVLAIALVFVGIGFLLSTMTSSRSRATTLGIVAWLMFVALGTLGIMAAFVQWGLPANVLVAWSFVNPIEAFRVGVISALDPDLSILGPVGAQIVGRFGSTGTVGLAGLVLTVWAVVPGMLGWWVFRRAKA